MSVAVRDSTRGKQNDACLTGMRLVAEATKLSNARAILPPRIRVFIAYLSHGVGGFAVGQGGGIGAVGGVSSDDLGGVHSSVVPGRDTSHEGGSSSDGDKELHFDFGWFELITISGMCESGGGG